MGNSEAQGACALFQCFFGKENELADPNQHF